jgi:cysteinyl-tRNA synthetase
MAWLSAGSSLRVEAGSSIALESLGLTSRPSSHDGISAEVWDAVREAAARPAPEDDSPRPTQAIETLVAERTAARSRGDWGEADNLRQQIASAGWEVRDTPGGPLLAPMVASDAHQ